MNDIVNKDNLFCDEYRALIPLEYPKELALVKQAIKLVSSAVENNNTTDTWSHEGICYMFARSIADYLKMSYDNLQLGHFYATQMIFRTIVENIVCLDIIQRNQKHELWKYYLVQSFRDSLKSFGKELDQREQNLLEEIYCTHNIDNEFIIKSKKKENQRPYAFIDRDYGWTYKINTEFTFSGLCKLIDQHEYKDFKLMSMYSHGTSIHLKISGFASMDNMMNMLSFYYYSLNRLAAMYCIKTIEPTFYKAMDKLERSITRYIKECK